MKYRPEIDGLRTIAVIPVILFHLQYSFFRGGFYGVDVFFVISGYLITSILSRQISDGSFSLADFWKRRIKRLLPLLLTVVLATLLITPLILFRPIVKSISAEALPAVFSYTNFHALFSLGDYWGWAGRDSFFLHTWSLSVEEQYYLIFPLILLLSFKLFRNLLTPVAGITVLSFIFFVCFLFKDPDIAFYMLPARLWELSSGGILALIVDRFRAWPQGKKNLLCLLALLMIFSSYFNSFNDSEKIGLEVVLAVSGASLVILFSGAEGFVGGMLSNRWMVFTGKISYSLYLWHWPVIVVFNNLEYQVSGYNRHMISLLVLTITVLLSVVSYYLIENKTRHHRHTLKIVPLMVVFVLMLTLYYNSEYFNIHYKSAYNRVSSYLNYFDISPLPAKLKNKELLTYETIMPERNKEHADAYKKDGIVTIAENRAPEIVVFGDSHGAMWAKAIDEVCGEMKYSRTFYTSNGTSPFFNINNLGNQKASQTFNQEERNLYALSIVKNIDKWRPKIFIIACRWDGVYEKGKALKQQLIDLITYLRSKNVSVIVINQPPVLHFVKNNNARQYITYLNIDPSEGYSYVTNYKSWQIEKSNLLIDSICRNNNAQMVDVYSRFIEGSTIRISYKKDFFFFDDDHLSYEGSLLCKDEIRNVIQKTME